MNALLIPLKPDPDMDLAHYCEKCGLEVEGRYSAQCPCCEMDFHPDCWWNNDYLFCLDCLLLDYARLDRMRWRLERWEEVVRERLLEGRTNG